MFILSVETKKKGRVRATVNTEELHSSLYITASQPTASATSLCVQVWGVHRKLTFRTKTKRIVKLSK